MASFQVKNLRAIITSLVNTTRGKTDKITDYNIGSVVLTLLEAVAVEIEEVYYQIFIGLIAATEFIYQAFNFPRRPATKAVGTVTFSATLAVASDVVISLGTIVATDDNVTFETTQEVTLTTGNTEVDAPVRSLITGKTGNVDAATIIIIQTQVDQITGVTNDTATAGGDTEESSEERRGRFAIFIASLSRATNIALRFGGQDQVDGISFIEIIENTRVHTLVEDVSAATFSEISLNMNINDPFGQSVEIFPNPIEIGDNVYFGIDFAFDFISFHVTDPASGAGGDGDWQYFNGSSWTNFPGANITDKTDKFRVDGVTRGVAWVKPADFTYTRVNGILNYWVRFNITDGGFSSNPKIALAEIPPFRGYVYVFAQNPVGEAPLSLLQASQSQLEKFRAAGVKVNVFAPEQVPLDVTMELTIDSVYDADALASEIQQSIQNFLTTKHIGEIIYTADLIQLSQNHNDKAVLDSDLTLLRPTALPTAPTVDDVLIGRNQIARVGTVIVTAVKVA